MENSEIENIWSDFIKIFPYTDKHLDTIVNCCTKDNINPNIFSNNLFFLTGKKALDTQEIAEPTKSISSLLKYTPPGFSLFFIAAYPDIVLWFMNNYDSENQSDNIYFSELKNNKEKYIDQDNTIKSIFFLLIRAAYIKTSGFIKFECSF